METLKQVLSVMGSIVGLLTALIPLYARFVDKKRAARKDEPRRFVRARSVLRKSAGAEVEDEPRKYVHARHVSTRTNAAEIEHEARKTVRGRHDLPKVIAVEVEDEHEDYYEAQIDSKQLERAKTLVRKPAIALIAAGFVGLVFNLFIAGFGYVDQFVTPLSTRNNQWPNGGNQGIADKEEDQASTVMAIVMMVTFSFACGMAIWAGYNMIKLRSYWLSMAGSFAVMPGACICFFAGVPIGIWSLTVLLKPEVSSAFT